MLKQFRVGEPERVAQPADELRSAVGTRCSSGTERNRRRSSSSRTKRSSTSTVRCSIIARPTARAAPPPALEGQRSGSSRHRAARTGAGDATPRLGVGRHGAGSPAAGRATRVDPLHIRSPGCSGLRHRHLGHPPGPPVAEEHSLQKHSHSRAVVNRFAEVLARATDDEMSEFPALFRRAPATMTTKDDMPLLSRIEPRRRALGPGHPLRRCRRAPTPRASPSATFGRAGVRASVITVNLNDDSVKVSVALPRHGVGSRETFRSLLHRVRPGAAVTGTYFGHAGRAAGG